MPEEIKNQVLANYRSRLWIGLASALMLLGGSMALSGCGKNGVSGKGPTAGTVVKNSSGMEFAYVPAGGFQMGSNNPKVNERPIHQVTFARGFYMGRSEVTQAQWQKVMGDHSSSDKSCAENCPVDYVSWDDAQEFIKKLNAANDEYQYRLPSEAEWEYACRAGTTGDQSGDPNSAWFEATSGRKVHPVGQKQANAWNLYDMLGNVSEWVMDNYHDTYDGAPTDGSAWSSATDANKRVKRGGDYTDNVYGIRSSKRDGDDQGNSHSALGFRVVAVSRS